MQKITHVLEEKGNGVHIVKNFFLYESEGNILQQAQSFFTKKEKKEAKSLYKLNAENNPARQQVEREDLISHFLKGTIPNWNIKFNLL